MGDDAAQRHVEQLLEAGDLPAARDAIAKLPDSHESQVLLLEVALRSGSEPASRVMADLVRLMQKDPELERARRLYRLASESAYETRTSSPSHSHLPPEVTPDTGPGNDEPKPER